MVPMRVDKEVEAPFEPMWKWPPSSLLTPLLRGRRGGPPGASGDLVMGLTLGQGFE
jgi:hypothetical protein